jgi:hypothetical protein
MKDRARMRAWMGLLAIAALLPGCSTAGDRAASGMCPADETCAPETPDGLYFTGEDEYDTLGTTAVNGVQIVTVLDSDMRSFLLPFDAVASAPTFRVLSVSPPNVRMQGLVPGTAKLRILKHGTQELFDRVSLATEAPTGLRLAPPGLLFVDVDVSQPWGIVAGADVPLEVHLPAPDGTDLVDDTTQVIGAHVVVNQYAWNGFTVRAPAAGRIALSVVAAGTVFDASPIVLDRVTDIQALPWGSWSLTAGELEIVCFTGFDDQTQVSGLSWTFSTSDPSVGLEPAGNCANVSPTTPGSLTLVASALGFSKTFSFMVVAHKTSTMSLPIGARGPTPGERAR